MQSNKKACAKGMKSHSSGGLFESLSAPDIIDGIIIWQRGLKIEITSANRKDVPTLKL